MCWITYARSARGGGSLKLVRQAFQWVEKYNKKCYISDMLHHCTDKKAFTLAEVLITLGIIGVVAALTLPSLINKYKIKQLHTAFTRTSSILQNVLNETAVEFGYASFQDINSLCAGLPTAENGACKSKYNELFENINDFYTSRFRVVNTLQNEDVRKYRLSNFSNKTQTSYINIYGNGNIFCLPDGACITKLLFFYHNPADRISLTFDTNGPVKGPNRYGYDLFLYNTGGWTKLCSKKQDGGVYNGRGCYDYALKDINPDDNSKEYWASLY